MKSVSQVAQMTGISARTLQYYDKIGLLKPSGHTPAGYRIYDEEALQKLQQILFFKELGFTLQEIKSFLNQPDFDKITVFRKQKELLLLKRNRTDRLIQLLERLEKGENCMSFHEFDLTDYINALEDFKKSSTDAIIQYWGSMQNFDLFIQKIKDDESELAKLAIKQFGSIEKYTEEMKYNLEHFSQIMEKNMTDNVKEIVQQSDALYSALTSDLSRDAASDEIQHIVHEIQRFMLENTTTISLGKPYWNVIIDSYSSDYMKAITDTKYGSGAADYIVKAFQYCSDNECEKRK